MTPDINTLDAGALEPLTKVLFHFIDPNGLPMANRFFEIQLAESNFVDEDGVLMPKVMYVQTDEEGKYLAKLRESKKPYYVLMEGDTPQDVIAYSFYVPKADYVVRAQDLFIAVSPSEVPYDEEAIRLITEYKVDARNSANEAKVSEDKAKASEIIAVGAAADAEHSLSLLSDEVVRAKAHADASKEAAKTSETNAKASETSASNSASDATAAKVDAEAARDIAITKATESANSAQASKNSQTAAKASEDAAKASQTASKASEDSAKASATTASTKASEASTSATNASNSAAASANSASIALVAAQNAENSVNLFPKQFAQMATAIIETQTIVVSHHGFGD